MFKLNLYKAFNSKSNISQEMNLGLDKLNMKELKNLAVYVSLDVIIGNEKKDLKTQMDWFYKQVTTYRRLIHKLKA